MQRILIQAILDRIAAELPQFKTVDLFNDQFNKADNGKSNPVRFPALFVSFPEGAQYADLSAGLQETEDLTVRFYIAQGMTSETVGKTILEVMDLKQIVYSKFQGYGTDYIKTFHRINEEPDEERTNYYVFIQDYTTAVVDISKYIQEGETVTLTLDLTEEVIINPLTDNGIRTAKDTNDNG